MASSCLVCNSPSHFFLNSSFHIRGLEKVTYMKCEECGFTFSATHYSMSNDLFSQINQGCYEGFNPDKKNYNGFPPYLSQAMLFHVMVQNGFLEKGTWLNYAAGQTDFSTILKHNFNLDILSYDKYLTLDDKNFISEMEMKSQKFDLIFSSAFFEHITTIEPLENMVSALKHNGVLALHTVVCENIPCDPSWFYFLPVHCSFFTNKAMSIFMKKFGFVYSIYCPVAKTWLLYKEKPDNAEQRIVTFNLFIRDNFLHGKDGFVDYWKGF